MKKADEITFLIIEYMKIKGVIQFDATVADAIGITRQHLYNIKNGQHFSFENVCNFAKAYNVNLNIYTANQKNVFNTPESITVIALKRYILPKVADNKKTTIQPFSG